MVTDPPASITCWTTSSTSSTYRKMPTLVPRSSFGGFTDDCGIGSASMSTESPISSSAWPIVPIGVDMRMRSFAPNARL